MPLLSYLTDNFGILFAGKAETTGGTITEVSGDIVHTFSSSEPFEVGKDIPGAQVLLVAGGGGSSGYFGGGGGAGGLRFFPSVPFTKGSYNMTVGGGGSNSSLQYNGGTYSATRGGYGEGDDSTGFSGGSGGGGSDGGGGGSGNSGGYSPPEGNPGAVTPGNDNVGAGGG